jgi:hypothetical protein
MLLVGFLLIKNHINFKIVTRRKIYKERITPKIMEIKSVDDFETTLSLTGFEKGRYKDFREVQAFSEKRDDYHLGRVVNEKFSELVNPFLKSIGLNPKEHVWPPGKKREVKCEGFKIGEPNDRHGFVYTPVVVFRLDDEGINVSESYGEAGRSTTTLYLAKDIVNLIYPKMGDGLETPKVKVSEKKGNPIIYVASTKQLKTVLTRLQEVFNSMGDDRLGALVNLYYQAEEQESKNKFLSGLYKRNYRSLLETLVR